MLMFKLNLFISLNTLLITCTFMRQSYQQTTATTNSLDKHLTFCIQNHKMANTLKTFWHDANADCELESMRLIQLYSQLLEASVSKDDQCSALLKHKIRRKLIQTVSSQLEEAFIVKSITTNRELKQVLKSLQEIDEGATQSIWERVINEVYWFVTPEEIISEIMHLKEQETQIAALQSLLSKYLYSDAVFEHSKTLIPLLTFHINSLFKRKTSSASFLENLHRFYRRLPKVLRLLYESPQQRIGLLNYHQFEYLYAPRDNGPDSERRVPLTWSETKNSTDSDGHLMASFNAKGLVAFGSSFGASLKYLYADDEHQAAYFWIGSGVKTSQWWQIIWPHESYLSELPGYIIFQNDVTKDLLCATTEYDESRRYVTLLNAKENIENPAGYWVVTRF